MSAIGGVSSMAGMMPQVVSGASMRMPPAQKMDNLFQQIDTSNTGSITKAQFEQAFQTLKMPSSFKAAGADAVFSKLDPNGTGSVSKKDFVNGMKAMMVQNRQHHASAAQNTPPTAQTLSSSMNALNALGSQATLGKNVNTYA